jgi:hypothetical protein
MASFATAILVVVLPLLPVLLFPLAVWPPLWRGLAALAARAARRRSALLPAATLPAFLAFCLDQRQAAALPARPDSAVRAAGGARPHPGAACGGRRDVLPASAALALVGAALAAVGSLRRAGLPSWAAGHSPVIGLALLAVAVGAFRLVP